MILNDKDALNRLGSSSNLMNRLSSLRSNDRKNSMNLFIPPSVGKKVDISIVKNEENDTEVTFIKKHVPRDENIEKNNLNNLNSPVIEELIPNSDDQVKLALAHDKAINVMNSALATLEYKLDDIKADRLPSVITAASKVVESIRRDRIEASKVGANKEVHYHFYTPQQKTIDQYEIIDVA